MRILDITRVLTLELDTPLQYREKESEIWIDFYTVRDLIEAEGITQTLIKADWRIAPAKRIVFEAQITQENEYVGSGQVLLVSDLLRDYVNKNAKITVEIVDATCSTNINKPRE